MLSAFSRSLVLAVVLAAPVLAAPPETEQLRVSVTADTERFAEPRAVELTLRANIPGPAPSGWMLKFDWQLNGGAIPGYQGARISAGATVEKVRVYVTKVGSPGPVSLKVTLPDGRVMTTVPFRFARHRANAR